MANAGKMVEKKASESRWLQVWSTKKWVVILTVAAFMLGRASILDQLSPFAIAFFAVVVSLRKDMVALAGAAAVAGSLFSPHLHTAAIVTELLVFLLLYRAIEKYQRTDLTVVPLLVGTTVFVVRLFQYLVGSEISLFMTLMAAIEGVLGFILTLIFLQAVPVFAPGRKSHRLKNEEIICLIILLASVMTGTVGWGAGTLSLENVLSRYLVLLFAFVGGAPLGASVGVVTGMILSLADTNSVYQISLLAFAGMLGGLMKEGGRMAVAFGTLLGSSILSFYIGSETAVLSSAWESAIAIALFLLTGKGLVRGLSRYIPGTQENMKSHYEYAKRVRDITAGRVEQFSEVFRQLSSSFKQLNGDSEDRKEAEREHFMDAVAEKACASCYRKDVCWNGQFYQTYKFMTEMMTAIDGDENFDKSKIKPEWKKACIKTDAVLPIMKQQYMLYRNDQRWKRQILESRQLVADQLVGVSQVMEDLAREIKREGQELYEQEEQIRSALEELGLAIQAIDIISLDEGSVEIEIIHTYTRGFDECRKIIAPLLSDILGETITVKKEEPYAKGDGRNMVTFGSAKTYEVETGVAGAAKGGDLLSGDSFSTVELGNGKFAVALSDGMGNGERARAESSAALTILQQLLQSGMDEKLAIKSVNSVLMLRSPEEIYATVDMALIDQYNAKTTFMKIGSTPSFIKRDGEVISISANNLPVGILKDIDVDLVSLQLHPGDVLIMMTDGIYDAPGYAVNKELWMKRIIQEIQAKDPQEIADCLLEKIVRHQQGEISDDMTVVVARVELYRPDWAAFRWPGVGRVERPKVVS
ncbi:stage II sporulation protein E [Gorillibacterium massiliense]|uniref:stage II sporulation protein E n=1 Tax=Gorillibacterium massiliense TaxID=1280390 RepID=UPI002351E999|nr:stage II sporulation protein E [Gorillibacterium massiliense]